MLLVARVYGVQFIRLVKWQASWALGMIDLSAIGAMALCIFICCFRHHFDALEARTILANIRAMRRSRVHRVYSD